MPEPVANLRRLWEKKKQSFEYTQLKASQELGWTQGAFSQYLNNLTNLNDSAIIKLANFLDVDPKEIDPQFEDRAGVRWRKLPKATSISNVVTPPASTQYFDNDMIAKSQLIYVDVELPPIATTGSYLMVCNEKHVSMQSRLSNMDHDLWGIYKEFDDGPWHIAPYIEIPAEIDVSLKRIVICTLWI